MIYFSVHTKNRLPGDINGEDDIVFKESVCIGSIPLKCPWEYANISNKIATIRYMAVLSN